MGSEDKIMEKNQAVKHVTFGEGIVIEDNGGDRLKVRFTIGDKILLRGFVTLMEHTAKTKALCCAGTPVKTTLVSKLSFVNYLESEGYKLYVNAYRPEERLKAESEYREWSGGAELPDVCVGEYYSPNKSTFGHHEWFLKCEYSDDMPCSLPIIEAGSIGKGNTSGPAHGLRNKGSVSFCFTETVEELVRAGLRAR